MIISKTIKITVSGGNVKHFKNLEYNVKYLDVITIPIEQLQKGSNKKIKVKCDVCGEEKETTYSNYLQSISRHNIYACSSRCAHDSGKNKKTKLKNHGNENFNNMKKRINTNLEIYGVEHSFQNEEIKNKSKQTIIKNYGVENVSQSEEIKNKKKNTCLKNHGVESPAQSKEILKKTNETNLKKYGVEWSLQSSEIREKGKQTKKEKYDNENYTNQNKTKRTNLKNLGVEMPFQSQEIQDKCKQTLFENHGVENPFQIPEVVYKNFETKFGYPYEQYLEQLPDFKRYRNEVWKITRKQPLNMLENYNKRGLREYHIDHKFSISEGFKQNICPYIIGNIINLEMLTWEDNLSKNYKCSITKEKLFKKYDNNNIYILKNDIF